MGSVIYNVVEKLIKCENNITKFEDYNLNANEKIMLEETIRQLRMTIETLKHEE